MSRDSYIQDIPAGAASSDEMPDNFQPQPLPFTAAQLGSTITALWPKTVLREDGSGSIEDGSLEIALSIDDEEPLKTFALFDRSGDLDSADRLISELLAGLNVRAFEISTRRTVPSRLLAVAP